MYNIIKSIIDEYHAEQKRKKAKEEELVDMEYFMKNLRRGLRMPPELPGKQQ